MPAADKLYGKFLPDEINPVDRVCFVIEIPDTLQYRAALMGQLLWLADWRCWQHEQSDYPSPPADNVAAAELFAIAVTDARFEDCDDMATCEQIIECIETDEDTQAAFNAWLLEQVTNNSDVQQALDDLASHESAVGRSLTPGQAAANLLPASLTDDCSRARLGAAMEFLAEYIDTLITDLFEVLISLDTAAKLAAKASGLIPVVGQYVETAAEFLLELKNKIITSYAGEMTGEVKLSIAGDWFCKAEPDCDLSIDDAIEVITTRLGEITPAEFGSIITLLTTGTFVGVQIVETAYLVALAAVKFGGKFGDSVGVQPMSVIIAQGAGVPNTFWNDYDCPTEPVCITYDRDNSTGWTWTTSSLATAPAWRTIPGNEHMQGGITGLALTGYTTITFDFDLYPFDVVNYAYIRVITQAGAYSYAGSFTGSDYHHAQAIIVIPSTDVIATIEFRILGYADSEYQVNFVSVCP